MKEIEALDELDSAIMEQANQAIPSLTSGDTYKMKAFFSEAFLEAFDRQHPRIGERLASLVAQELLPLKLIGRTKSNHNLYKIL
tara:strand:- start:515 stop:766 length:252 start_codon:yes stop_codon:yes gene_type:complete